MQCKKCGVVKDQLLFATFHTRKGELRRRGECWDCRAKNSKKTQEEQKQYRKEYNQKNRSRQALASAERRKVAKDFVDSIKSQSPCKDCGGFFPPVAMDFDHAGAPKNRAVSKMVSAAYKLDIIKAEIAKCELVCSNCHRVRTHSRKENWWLPPTEVDLFGEPTQSGVDPTLSVLRIQP